MATQELELDPAESDVVRIDAPPRPRTRVSACVDCWQAPVHVGEHGRCFTCLDKLRRAMRTGRASWEPHREGGRKSEARAELERYETKPPFPPAWEQKPVVW